jgi:hypothetical protein
MYKYKFVSNADLLFSTVILFHFISVGILGSKRNEVTGGWRKLHNNQLPDLYSSLNTIRMIKWRRTRWTGHVARKVKNINAYRLWWERERERNN